MLSFTLGWHHSTFVSSYSKNRKSKGFVLVTIPVLYFLSYEISLYHQIYPADPITTALSSSLMLPILLYTYAITICGILFGFGFQSVSRAVSQRFPVRDYMVITACGCILFLNSAQATVLQAGYPSYGLANVSFVGLAFFLILTGLFNSTVSVAQDVKLRRSIKSSALLPSSKLLDNIGTAQLTKEIEDKVMKMTEDDAYALTQEWSSTISSRQ
jgi:hypothetical protein